MCLFAPCFVNAYTLNIKPRGTIIVVNKLWNKLFFAMLKRDRWLFSRNKSTECCFFLPARQFGDFLFKFIEFLVPIHLSFNWSVPQQWFFQFIFKLTLHFLKWHAKNRFHVVFFGCRSFLGGSRFSSKYF